MIKVGCYPEKGIAFPQRTSCLPGKYQVVRRRLTASYKLLITRYGFNRLMILRGWKGTNLLQGR